MSEQNLRFWRQVEPTPGDVSLVFGDWPGVALRFVTKVQATPGPVSLVFGAQPVAAEDVSGTLAATLPAPVVSGLSFSASGAQTTAPVGATLSATLTAPTLPSLAFAASDYLPEVTLAAALPPAALPALTLASAAVDYDQALPDAIGPGLAASAQQGATLAPAGLAANQQQFLPTAAPASAQHTAADPLHIGAAARQMQMLPAGQRTHTPWQHGAKLGGGTRAWHADMLRQRRTITTPAQHGIPVGQGARSEHQERVRFRHRLRSDQQHGIKAGTGTTTGHKQGIPLAKGATVRQQQMIPLPLGWWQIAYPWPKEPIDPNAPSSPVALKFCRLADGTTALIFGCPPLAPQPGGIIVPIRRAYIVLNTITLARASDGAPLSALSLSLQIDADSWTWGWDASIPGAELALVEPAAGGDPVELLATVNGQQFRLLAERIARDRRFAQSRIRISGRGRAAMLADPHSPIVTRSNAAARTMQQLLADALTINNVGIGWAVDWQAADWLVPAGLYNHAGSYIAHAQRLAEAAGAYVQADPLLDTLRILPRYPLLPWEWSAATPDITLPSAAVVREAIEWQDKAAYNRVFVSGTEAGGVLGQITRAGTAGDVVAPMITDPLITHADGARARGRPILADTGRQARITLELPILPETGIITPGKLVQYTDAGTARRGLVRSTAVTAQLPTARQTIELETHA